MPDQEEIWRRYDAIEVRLTAALSERMLDLADLRPGMRVLDLATGRGEPALRAAKRVGPTGLVVGVDPSDGLLGMARARAELEGVSNLELRATNAELPSGLARASFDAVTCRWGLMYMADPVAALRNARQSLVRDGVLVAAFWAEPERVPYYSLPHELLAPYRSIPELDPEAPGTFRYATRERIERDLAEASWGLDHIEELAVPVFETQSSAQLIDWVRVLGLGRLLDEMPEAHQRAWEQQLIRRVEQISPANTLRLGGITRIVRALPRA